jgi:hypothetical protein
MARRDKPQKEPKKPEGGKEKTPKPSPARDKEKMRSDIRAAFIAAFGHEKI